MAQSKETLYKLQIFVSSVCPDYEVLDVQARKDTTSEELIQVVAERLKLDPSQNYDLAEVMVTARGQTCKERRLEGSENPVAVQLLWPKPLVGIENDQSNQTKYSFCLREKQIEIVGRVIGWGEGLIDFHNMDSFLSRFLHQPWNKEYPDLCNLPDLNEHTLLENLKARFFNGHIYTYVGSILIAVNPFKFYPIYNPKYVKLYQNRRLGELPPHIFAIADSAYHTMLRDRANQCIVISGESGSGKTESTNFLLHHLTALSQKGHHGSGVEQTILGAGPVLEAFGNAKTAHNNNSSRFGKFIQVNYKENGMVHGAVVQKYLLEKSRIVSQAKNERNYHVFYYLLAGASETEKEQYYLDKPEDYFYLNQSDCYSLSGVDENYEFARLKQSMEMVGFATETQKRLFCVLSAVLHLGNIQFTNRSTYYHDESVSVKNPDLLKIISNLLRVKEETLMSALTSKKTIARTETLVINYKMHEAIATRDALAKCLYGALFDWIVLQVNHALMAKKDTREHHGNAIGVLDIFGFENFENNSFEQFCINFANEHLQYYFNEHVFRFEQDEYKREGICWKNIDFVDNTGCLNLIEGRPTGLLSLIDEECNFPGGTNETLIEKFNQQHKNNDFYEVPQKRESAFIVNHYAGKVKYSTKDFREKNSDLMRPDIVSVLKNSSMSFVRELVGIDPVAVFRWAILRAFFRSVFVFINAGKQHRKKGAANKAWRKSYPGKIVPANENMLSISKWSSAKDGSVRRPLASMHDNVAYELEGMCLHGVMTESQAKVFHRANRILMKHKSFKPKLKANKCLKDLQALKTLTGKSVARSSRKQPPTVGAQFQASLSKLMETLNQANPFFVRCMKSNGEKAPCKFDKEIILRQLRYTGMLETVRIRRCGYNVRLTFEEFIQVYRIILPSGLLSSRAEVVRFLETMNLNKVNYQLGSTKLFFRESEKVKLDEKLHMEIMHRIVAIQYWWKTILERRQFLRLKDCTIRIQSRIRCYLAQRKLVRLKMRVLAAIFIQKFWRGYCCQRRYVVLRRGVIWVQSVHRGNLARQRYWLILEDRRQQQKRLERDMDLHSSQSDEGILTQENSQEELSVCYRPAPAHDSEESSGILDDSETESMASESHHQPQSLGLTPPISPFSEHYTESPPSPLSPVEVRPYSTYGEQIVPRRRVSDMTKAFSTGTTEEKTKKTSKKNSAKKMKPIKSPSSDALYTQDKNIDHTLIRRQTSLTDSRHLEERENSLKILTSNMDQREVLEKLIKERESNSDYSSNTQRSPVSQHKGRFHKARQHLKTFIGGGKKPMKRPTCVTDDSEDSQTEDQLCPTLKNSHDVGVLPVESLDEQLDTPDMKEEPVMKDMHSFKHAKFHKGETCSVCGKNFTGLFTQGSKCIVCKLAYHQKCMQNAGQCLGNKTSPRVSPKNNRKVRKHSKTSLDMKSPKKWNLTGTSEFTDRADQIISDVNELRSMDSFIFSKITRMSQDGRRDTIVDVVFKTALKEFHRHLVSTYSVAAQVCPTDGNLSIKYKDLIVNFEQTMATVCKQKNTSATFPVTMGINAFRGFLDEFMNLQKVDDKPKYKTLRRKRKEDKKKGDTNMEHLGHNFMGIVMNIPTACEYCSSFMWLMERGMVCHSCKLTCHKKCCTKVTSECQGFRSSSEVQEDYQFRIFRVPLSNLVSDDIKIPTVVEKLISSIELKGLYTEGIYRKSGSSAKVKLLRLAIDNDLKNLNLDSFAVHVLTTTLKLFFREMPESLMTSDLYDDFLRASDLTDSQERIRTFYSIIQKLPKCNHNLLERLIFHLARVAQHEEANRMSANSLAIVFAPCILRTNKQVQAQDSLNDVSRQTMCVEVIIEEQLRKLKATLEDIDTLESATATASNRLSALRSSKIFLTSQLHLSKIDNIDDTGTSPNEEEILSEHIRSLEQEKALLTTTLPRLTRNSSDDDMISGDDLESTFDSIMDEMEDDVYEEYALTFDLPVSPPTALRHLNKHRADVPMKRKPSRFSYYNIVSSQHDSIPSDTTIVSIYHPATASDLYEDDVIMV